MNVDKDTSEHLNVSYFLDSSAKERRLVLLGDVFHNSFRLSHLKVLIYEVRDVREIKA
jgi:hypothetical protein